MKEDKTTNAIANTDATSWDRIRGELFPNSIFRRLPDKELESCDILVDAIANSSTCYPIDGDVVARFDEIFELVFRIQDTILSRYVWHNGRLIPRKPGFIERIDIGSPNANVPVRRRIRMEMRPAHGNLHHLGSSIGCVWSHGGNRDDPVMNDCAGFVLWAESGFPGFSGNLRTTMVEYRIRTYLHDVVDQVRVSALSMSWEDAFEAYEFSENYSQEDDESDYERLARRAILRWMLFPDSNPFTDPVEKMSSEAIARMIFKEFDEDRRYQ